MKNILLVMFALASTVSLSACESVGNHDLNATAPYNMERTATSTERLATIETPAPAPAPHECAPAPVCESCTDVAPLRARISELENLLARCQEGKSRVQTSYREELEK